MDHHRKKRPPEAKRKDVSEWSYYADVDEIFHARWSAKQLARFDVVREAVHHFWPDGYPVKLIQVAGTSGKGSTCRFIQAGLSDYGKSGAYVKPHVFDFAERFIVDGRPVGHSEIARAWEAEVRPYAIESALKGEAWELDHFEASLLLALKIFERRGLRWGVVETGMGGRYDPVTALEVIATVVTNVGEDHEEVLGAEHWQRALEKAGICRPGIPLFSGDQDRRSDQVLRGICRDVGAPFHRLTPREVGAVRDMVASEAMGGPDELLNSEHQMVNATLAADVVGSLVGRIDLKRLVRRFLAASYVGRFWRIEKDVYADVAHNPSKTRALADELKGKFPRTKKVFVIGISGPRDPVAVMAPLITQAKAIVVTAAGFKGQDPDKVYVRLRDAFPKTPIHLAPNPLTTLSVAKKLRGQSDVIVFTGSTYMVDQALNKDDHLRHLNASVGWREVPRSTGPSPPGEKR
jgi:dihydrofolate synthase / folylpolyglutamate synthase